MTYSIETDHGKSIAKVVVTETGREVFTVTVTDPLDWGDAGNVNSPSVNWPSIGSVSPELALAASEAIQKAVNVANARARSANHALIVGRHQS